MMAEADREVYTKTHRSTVNRYKARASYDHAVVHGIIDASPVAHVSFLPTSRDDDPFPTILPMLACTGAYTAPGDQELAATAIYLHGSAASRLMYLHDEGRPENEGLPGVPVCIAATLFDGLVLALTPFAHSANYRSAVVHGYAVTVTSPAEKMYALKRLTDSLVPGRWENTRVPPTAGEMKATAVLRVDIVSASAKIRAAAPGNERADLDSEEVRGRVWTGVVPASVVLSEPVPATENKVQKVPDHIRDWVDSQNVEGEEYARRVASVKK